MPPLAVTLTDATERHVPDPPLTVGAPGTVRSILTESVTQAETRPTPSTALNPTVVVPWPLTTAVGPPVAALHVAPPSVEVRY